MGIVSDFQTYLQSLSPDVIDGDSGWPSVRRRVHDGSDRLVVFSEDGGFDPETPSEEGIGDSAMMEPAVQVRVRAEAWNGDAASAKAREIFGIFHGLMRVTMGDQYYIRIKAQTPEPLFMGFDGNGRPEMTISFRALRAVA